jgi:aryl-alcohol dehydrogenase-like predicted oxidoreductase
MGMTAFYGDMNNEEQEAKSIETIGRGLELGLNFYDTAWVYQTFGADGKENSFNEKLLGKAIKKYGREKFVIATKFGIGFNANFEQVLCGKPDFMRSQLAESLERLGIDCVDLYYQHRMDVSTPIEETMEGFKNLLWGYQNVLHRNLDVLMQSILSLVFRWNIHFNHEKLRRK